MEYMQFHSMLESMNVVSGETNFYVEALMRLRNVWNMYW
mgnify:CR=1 FL=1